MTVEESGRDVFTIDIDGQPVEVWQNKAGGLHDAGSGKILAPPTPNTFDDPNKARDAAFIRWARHQEVRREGILTAVQSVAPEVKTLEQADSYITRRLTAEILLNKDVPARERLQAYSKVLGYAGLLPGDGRKQPKVYRVNSINLTLLDTNGLMLKALLDRYGGDMELAQKEFARLNSG